MVRAVRTFAVLASLTLLAGTTAADSGLVSSRAGQKAEPSQADQLRARKARADRLAWQRLVILALQASGTEIPLPETIIRSLDNRAPGP